MFYTFDPQGSAAERLNGQGSVLTEQTIGFPDHRVGTDQSSDGLSNFQAQDPFSGYRGQWGYYLDNETLYELLTSRYFVPYQPQFLTRDPAGFAGGSNLYEYAGDDFANNADPSGLSPDADILPNFPGTITGRSGWLGSTAAGQANVWQMENGFADSLPGIGVGNLLYGIGTGGSLLNGQTYSSGQRWGMAGGLGLGLLAGAAWDAAGGGGELGAGSGGDAEEIAYHYSPVGNLDQTGIGSGNDFNYVTDFNADWYINTVGDPTPILEEMTATRPLTYQYPVNIQGLALEELEATEMGASVLQHTGSIPPERVGPPIVLPPGMHP